MKSCRLATLIFTRLLNGRFELSEETFCKMLPDRRGECDLKTNEIKENQEVISTWRKKRLYPKFGGGRIQCGHPGTWKNASNLKTYRRGLKKISTYRTNLIISRTIMVNHASLALKCKAVVSRFDPLND